MIVGRVLAQGPSIAVEWIRVESPSGDISFALPAAGNIVFNDDGGYRIWHNETGVSINFMMRRNVDPKSMIKFVPKDVKSNDKFYEMGNFIIRQYVVPDKDTNIPVQYLTIASSKGYYTISARVSKDQQNIYASFLNSIRLKETPLFKGNINAPDTTRTIRINDLKTDDVVLEALKRPDARNLKLEPDDNAAAARQTPVVYSRDIVFLSRPRPTYTDSARQRGAQGTVILSVTFQADGQIGRVTLKRSLDRDLDRTALDAVKKIKFLPAEVDGNPVNTTRTIEYNFSIY